MACRILDAPISVLNEAESVAEKMPAITICGTGLMSWDIMSIPPKNKNKNKDLSWASHR